MPDEKETVIVIKNKYTFNLLAMYILDNAATDYLITRHRLWTIEIDDSDAHQVEHINKLFHTLSTNLNIIQIKITRQMTLLYVKF